MNIRTSMTSPIRIDEAAVPGQAGVIGLTLCPGKNGHSSWGNYRWERDLEIDVQAVSVWDPAVWVNLMEHDEMRRWGVGALPQVAESVCPYFSLPIIDGQAPGKHFESEWLRVGAVVRESLRSGNRVLLHCRGGMGRAGTVAARLLVEFGMQPDQAIRAVRARRTGAVETAAQVAYVKNLTHLKGIANLEGHRIAEVSIEAATPSPAERVRGGLLGLLVGDALGVPYEFKPSTKIPPRQDIEMIPPGGYPSSYPNVPPGTWSDDGAQALCLVETLVESDGLDPEKLGQILLRWRYHGHAAVDGIVFDIGNQTSDALGRIRDGVPALRAGGTHSNSCGNGSLMRVLGLALWHKGDIDELFELAMRQSMVTHGHLQAQLCCALYCGVARFLLQGEQALPAWNLAISALERHCANDPVRATALQREIIGSAYRLKPTGSGYVVDTLWSAHLCLNQTDYEACVRTAIALGSDTDTTAAVAGGLAGILYGERAIPTRWITALRGKPLAETALLALEARTDSPCQSPGGKDWTTGTSRSAGSPVAQALAQLAPGVIQQFKNLTVLPLLSSKGVAAEYELLDRALQKGTARITEISEAGSVPELRFEHRGGTPILLIDGEELMGARQNRILNVTILAGAGKTLVIPVSCVERGRWAYQQRHLNGSEQILFGSARRAKARAVTASLRSRGVAVADQEQIWRSIDERFGSTMPGSKTSAMSDLYDSERNRIEEFQNAFDWVPGQAGAVVAIDGEPVGLELFDSPETYRQFNRKLIGSFAMDALAGTQVREARPDRKVFERFLSQVSNAPIEKFRALGEGHDLRLTGGKVNGGALEFRGRLLHFSAFAAIDE